MKKLVKRSLIYLLTVTMLLSTAPFAFAESSSDLDSAIKDTAEYIYETVSTPELGSVGGEWAVLGLARSDFEAPDEYYQNYYKAIEEYVSEHKGILHEKKYTEYSRLIITLTAIGKDPTDVGGYNLLTPLGDYDKTIFQGMNGPIWALIALDSSNYDMPENTTAEIQATRDMYVQRILDCQLADGGWSLFGGTDSETAEFAVSEPDITGMALQALAKYQDREDVKKACDEALACMSDIQNSNAGFSSWGSENIESCVQMAVALCELGISLDDERFVKNEKTMFDNIMSFYVEGSGFLHTKSQDSTNQMATEQGFYALIAISRAMNDKNSLYRMSDAVNVGNKDDIPAVGLPNKHKDVNTPKVTKIGKTFDDVQKHNNQLAIEALASREIINGKTETIFEPNATMTRAEFATIIVKALGLIPNTSNTFTDVKAEDWFAPFVGTASTYNIVSGKSQSFFDPNGVITREEAAAMVSRAAKLCGMDTEYETIEARDLLSQFTDYVKSSSWARVSLAFCYDNKILDSSVMEIQSKENIKRCEVAQMVFNMLSCAKLL